MSYSTPQPIRRINTTLTNVAIRTFEWFAINLIWLVVIGLAAWLPSIAQETFIQQDLNAATSVEIAPLSSVRDLLRRGGSIRDRIVEEAAQTNEGVSGSVVEGSSEDEATLTEEVPIETNVWEQRWETFRLWVDVQARSYNQLPAFAQFTTMTQIGVYLIGIVSFIVLNTYEFYHLTVITFYKPKPINAEQQAMPAGNATSQVSITANAPNTDRTNTKPIK